MKIRPAKPSDASQVVALVNRVLREEYPLDQAAYSTEDLDRLKETYLKPSCTFLVAEENRRIIGTCGVKAEGLETAILRRLFVDPEYRAQGVGTHLLEQALDFCRQQEFHEVVIRTSTRMEKAIRLCCSLGFTEAGRWELGEVTLVRYQLKLF